MAGYDASAWFEFAVAVVGAAAALSGLLFVAMSINIERIVSVSEVPSMAAGSLFLVALPLLVGLFLLIPDQAIAALGLELLVTGLVSAGVFLDLNRPSHRAPEESKAAWLFARYLPSLAVAALTTTLGATLLAGAGGGLYWIAPAVTLAFVTGLTGAWVLLVEILR